MAEQADRPLKKEWTTRDTTILASIILLPIGAGMAWGFGGLIFGWGLWLTIGLATESIEDAIKAHSR